MRITKRQKNIPNPFYTDYEYDWQNSRNRIVISCIHEMLTNLYIAPKVGDILFPSSLGIGQGDSLKEEDLRAYISLYPQNAILVEQKLDYIADSEGINALKGVAQKIKDSDPDGTGITKNFTSNTTKESQIPPAHNPVPGALDLSTETIYSRLVSFPEASASKKKVLRAIIGRPQQTALIDESGTTSAGGFKFPYTNSGVGNSGDLINIYDWRKNIEPSSVDETVYFNADDESYYFLKRTNSINKKDYDISLPTDQSISNKAAAIRLGVEKILKMLGSYNPDIFADVLGRPEEIQYKTYISERPADRWVYAIIIPQRILETITRGIPGLSLEDDMFVTDFIDILLDTQKVSISSGATYSDVTYSEMYTNTLSLMRYYQSTLNIEMITPEMVGGFNIASEIAKVEIFDASLRALLETNDFEWDSETKKLALNETDNKVEIKLSDKKQLLFVVANGTYIYEPLGVTPFTPGNEASENPSGNNSSLRFPNAFSACTPRTFGIIENLKILSEEYKKETNQRMPWSEFIKTMVFPRVTISPSKEQEEIRKKLSIGFSSTKAFTQNIFEAAEDRVPLDSVALNRRFFDTRYALQSIPSQLQRATNGCDSGLSKLAKAVNDLWPLIQREDWLAAGASAATVIKEQLLKDKAQQEMISNAMLVVNPNNPLNPLGSPAAKEATKWLDEEISCLLDNLGKLTAEAILPPTADPGDGKKLIKTLGSDFPLKFDFSSPQRLANSTFSIPRNIEDDRLWKAWRKSLMKQVEKLIKQLILAVIQDLLKALLGCGYGKSSPDNRTASLYGLSNINTFFYEQENPDDANSDPIVVINIKPAATKVGFVNRQFKDDFSIQEVPITDKQLIALNYDISRMTTPDEIKLLLDGDAPESLIFSLVEMINKGDVDLTGIPREMINNPVALSLRQESFARGDERYAMLGIDSSNLREYLFQLGELMTPEQKERAAAVPDPDAVEDFCLDPEPPRNDVSEEQVLMNLDASIVAKQKELENLCEMFNFNNPLQGSLDGVFDLLEVPDWYKAGLDAIAEFINWAFSWLGSQDGNLADSADARASQTPFQNTYSGKQILTNNPGMGHQHYFPQYRRMAFDSDKFYCVSPNTKSSVDDSVEAFMQLSDNNLNFASSAWTPDEVASYQNEWYMPEQVGFIVDGNKVLYYLLDYTTGDRELLASAYFEDSNLKYLDRPLDQNPTPNSTLRAANNLSLRNLSTPDNRFPAPDIQRDEGIDEQGSLSLRGVSTETSTRTANQINDFLGAAALPENKQSSRIVSNPAPTAFTLVKWFYTSPATKSRLKPYGAALRQDFLMRNDFCENADEVRVADLVCGVVWERIRRFMWNVAPLVPGYHRINMPDCINVMSDYLYRKYETELEESGVLGLCLEYLWTVEKHYRTISDKEIVPWASGVEEQSMSMKDLLSPYSSPREKFKALFRFSLLGALKRLSLQKSFTSTINPQISGTQYRNMYPELYRHLSFQYGDTFNYVQNSNLWVERAQYFTPVPLMIALQYIAFDKIADPLQAVEQKNVQYLRQIARVDDDILNAIKGFGAGNIERNYLESFPRTINSKTYYNQESVDKDIVSYEEIKKLVNVVTEFRSQARPLLDQALSHIANGNGTGAENIFAESLSSIRSVYEQVKESYDLFNPDALPLIMFSSEGISNYVLGGGVSSIGSLGTIPDSFKSRIQSSGEGSIFSRNMSNFVTSQLWARLTIRRTDIGPFDDPFPFPKFFALLDQGNAQVQASIDKMKRYADLYLEFLVRYTIAYNELTMVHQRQSTTPSNVMYFMHDTLRKSVTAFNPEPFISEDRNSSLSDSNFMWGLQRDYNTTPLGEAGLQHGNISSDAAIGTKNAISVDNINKFLSNLKNS